MGKVHRCKAKAVDAIHGAERRQRNQSPPAIVVSAAAIAQHEAISAVEDAQEVW